MPRRAKVTMDDVAQAAGVSLQAVSIVVNNKPGISEPTRARIRKVIARLDYQPNLLARSLRGQRSCTVGVVIPSITNPFYSELVRGIEDEAQRHGYSVLLCNSDDDPQKWVNYLHSLRRRCITGLVAVTRRAHPAWTAALQNLAAQNVPVVAVGPRRPSDQVVQIAADDEGGMIKATSHLLDLGHERIGMILPPSLGPDDAENPRVTGFLKAHALRGKKVAPELLAAGGWRVSDGQGAAARLMGLPVPPTAIVASNDLAAVGAITKIKGLGRRVPADVAVVGYDNLSIAGWYDPALTTVEQPRHEMGRRAMQALLKRLERPGDPAEAVTFETTLIIRRSSGDFRHPRRSRVNAQPAAFRRPRNPLTKTSPGATFQNFSTAPGVSRKCAQNHRLTE